MTGTSYSTTSPYGCPSQFLNLPSGWELAPPDSDGIRIARVGGWGTHVVVYSTGAAYGTSNYGAGVFGAGTNWLQTNGAVPPAYKVIGCSLRVLMRTLSTCATCTKSLGQVKCAAGTALSVAECQTYAGDTAGRYFVQAWSSIYYPIGCWAYSTAQGPQVYYNTNPVQGNWVSTNAAPICTSASGNPTCV